MHKAKQAMAAYTRGSAYAALWDDKPGTLETGKLADRAVLSQDIFPVPAENIGETQIMLTMVGGRIVYSGQAGPP